jgi:hypothetical protein
MLHLLDIQMSLLLNMRTVDTGTIKNVVNLYLYLVECNVMKVYID